MSSSNQKAKKSGVSRASSGDQNKASVKRELFAPIIKSLNPLILKADDNQEHEESKTVQKVTDYKQMLAEVFDRLPAKQILEKGIGNESGVSRSRSIELFKAK